jgi:hypothetical protein
VVSLAIEVFFENRFVRKIRLKMRFVENKLKSTLQKFY